MAFVHIIFEKYLVPWFPSYFGRLKKCKKIRKTPSQPKLNSTSTLHNLSWVRHKNDFTNHPTITSPHTNSMSAISQLLLTRFWWNFKGRFLWTCRTDSNCQGDICPHNICPCDICPYQEYLSSYWPDFDETLKVGSWEHLEQIPTVTVSRQHLSGQHLSISGIS